MLPKAAFCEMTVVVVVIVVSMLKAAMRMFKIQGGYATKQDVPLGFSALSGSIAGIGYWGVPYPADSIKSRIQTDPRVAGRGFFSIGKTGEEHNLLVAASSFSFLSCLKLIVLGLFAPYVKANRL